MDGQVILRFFFEYGYVMFIPLMIIGGPIVTIIAAFLASTGVFDIRIIFILSVLADIIGDLLFYYIGHKWGMKFVDRIGKYIGITRKLILRLEKFFIVHGGKTIFMVKSTTGLCWATFVTAGIVKMSLKKFIKYSFFGGLLWSAFLSAIGYFFGYLYEQIAQYITYASWIVLIVAISVFGSISLVKKYKTAEIFADVVKK